MNLANLELAGFMVVESKSLYIYIHYSYYIYVYIYIFIFMYLYMYIYLSTHIYIYLFICIYIYIYLYSYSCSYLFFIYTCMYMYIYIVFDETPEPALVMGDTWIPSLVVKGVSQEPSQHLRTTSEDVLSAYIYIYLYIYICDPSPHQMLPKKMQKPQDLPPLWDFASIPLPRPLRQVPNWYRL